MPQILKDRQDLSLFFLLLSPILLLFTKEKSGLFKNIYSVITNKKTWVGYSSQEQKKWSLPKLKPSVLQPIDAFKIENQNKETLEKLDFFYAKDYTSQEDLFIIWKGIKNLGRYQMLNKSKQQYSYQKHHQSQNHKHPKRSYRHRHVFYKCLPISLSIKYFHCRKDINSSKDIRKQREGFCSRNKRRKKKKYYS